MRLCITGKPDNHYFYVIEDYKNAEGIKKTRTIESLGSAKVIREKYQVENAEQWCRDYIDKLNAERNASKLSGRRYITVKLQEHLPKSNKSCIFNAGYLLLDSLYHSFGMANICAEIMQEHPHIKGFDLDNVLRALLFGRILFPSSKLALTEKYQKRFIEDFELSVQHIYRAMDLLNINNSLIQDRLYYYTSQQIERDIHKIYYDCTNFYTEKEQEDADREDKTEDWQQEHTLRKYGRSKENRPNPIVQMGLFMDGDGMPLGFCINPGNTGEQTTMLPLEKELEKNFKQADVIVCTDAGLTSYDNCKYNNRADDDPLVQFGISGQRRFITTQSIKKLPRHLQQWALDAEDWSYIVRDQDTGRQKLISGVNLSELDSEEAYITHFNTVFFKERTTAEKQLDSRLVVTYSLKYREYLRSVRDRKIKRANKMLAAGSFDCENERSPRRYIDKKYFDGQGNEARSRTASLNQHRISEDEKYDGYYALSTNIFKEEMPVQNLIAIASRRWEIEECFRIMKTDLEARPFYHSKDCRIIAHFQICFMALLLLRGIERKIADHNKEQQSYPNGKYTMDEILYALRNMNVISVENGKGYMPDYENSELMTDLLTIFNLESFGKQVVFSDSLKNIIKKIRTSPKMYRNLKKA
jgi:transposase